MLATSAARAASVDCGELYEQVRQRFVGLVTELEPASLERVVPPTPAWRVRDVLAHVVGLTHDLNRGHFGRETPDEWTARQVDTRRRWPIAEIVAEWAVEAPTFEDGLRLFGYGQGSHFVGDLHAHLQDLHQALRLAPVDDPGVVLVALDFYLGSLDESLRADGAGTLVVVAGKERHQAGEGEPSATLTGSPFDLLRTLSGRRSLAQIEALEWEGDVGALAPRLSRYPLPERDLLD